MKGFNSVSALLTHEKNLRCDMAAATDQREAREYKEEESKHCH